MTGCAVCPHFLGAHRRTRLGTLYCPECRRRLTEVGRRMSAAGERWSEAAAAGDWDAADQVAEELEPIFAAFETLLRVVHRPADGDGAP